MGAGGRKAAQPTGGGAPAGSGGGKPKPRAEQPTRLVAKNRRAYFDYEVLEELECGIALKGTEVKSLREGQLNFGDGHARVKDGQLTLVAVHINPYKLGTHENHEALRPRRLLAKKREIHQLERKVGEKGFTLIPLAVYFNGRGVCKVKIGVCRGKKHYDKRHAIAARDAKRRMADARR
jgi:SsrA-binding protein